MRSPAGATPMVMVEHGFVQLGRWRRLSRCSEGTVASARTWFEVASIDYLAWLPSIRARAVDSVEPPAAAQ